MALNYIDDKITFFYFYQKQLTNRKPVEPKPQFFIHPH